MTRKHRDIFDTVDAYVHELLDPDKAAEVKLRIDNDPVWAAAYEQAIARLDTMRNAPPIEPSQQLIDGAIAAVTARAQRDVHRMRLRRAVAWGLPAAAAIVLAFVHIYFANLTPSPTQMHVYGQDRLHRGAEAALRVSIVNHNTGRPIEGVPVTIDLERSNDPPVRLASFTTNSLGTGSPRFTVPDWPDGEYDLHIRADTGDDADAVTRKVKLARPLRIMVSPDKPVYQPGQTIQVRCLAMNVGNRRPAAAQAVVFTVADPKGTVIFKQRDATSRFGIASMRCALADEIIHGLYTITCTIGDTESAATVDVKPYVLPKFRIDSTLDKPYYTPADQVRGSVHAAYFFGKPVDGGALDVKLVGRDVSEHVIADTRVTTDADGRATFALRLPSRLHGNETNSGDARLELQLTLTDAAGQTQSRSRDVLVTTRPLRVQLIPEAGTLVKGLENRIYLYAHYADGQPAAAEVSIAGVDQTLRTGELGVTSFLFRPQDDETKLTVRAVDDRGVVGRTDVTLDVGRQPHDFVLRTDKAVYTAGELMTLTGFGGGNQPIYIDLIRSGQTIFTDVMPIEQGRGYLAVDLPPDASGTYELVTYRFGHRGLPIRKRRVVYVQQANDVNIDVALDRKTYRPGERATLQLQLTDAQGSPLPGAISLAAVDEAVFHVLPQKPGMEATFFDLDRELMEPVMTVYPWSAAMALDAPAEQKRTFGQAIFSASAARGNDLERVLQHYVEIGMFDAQYADMIREATTNPYIREHYIPQLVEYGELSPELANLILNDGNTYSLSFDSYPAKARQAQQVKRNATQTLNKLWTALLFTMGAVAFVWILLKSSNLITALVSLMTLAFVIGLLLPALGAARRTARQMQEVTALRGLAQSEIMAKQQGQTYDNMTAAGLDASPAALRVREWFPETLLWRPELITDDAGRVSLDVDLADSITTWRLNASAVTADGKLGGHEAAINVFQPFFVDLDLPVALTRGDAVDIPIVIYNYLDTEQTVELTVKASDWFERRDDGGAMRVTLAPNAVTSAHLPITAIKVGKHDLEVTARAGGAADAIRKQVTVEPDGAPMTRTFNGTLSDDADLTFHIPQSVIDGSIVATLKLYPSTFSQVVEGLEGIFQKPYGCFEQTSSTTYPNVLALDYLKRTGRDAPDVTAKARQYIHLGYQRLLSFEVDGGGFDWFGNPPANVTLTAYGLMEFRDMARVHDVDPDLIQRTRAWLLEKRQTDGSWTTTGRFNVGDNLGTTAYVAWAVFDGDRSRSAETWNYLVRVDPNTIDNAHTVALVAIALLAMNPDSAAVRPWLARLANMAQHDDKLTYWPLSRGRHTTFYGSGHAGNIETTALAVMAIVRSGQYPNLANRALPWLIEQKDGSGTWHSTQATVLALRALLAGTSAPIGEDKPRHVRWHVNDGEAQAIHIDADQGEVMKQIDLSPVVASGGNRINLTELTDTAMTYQLAVRWHVPQLQTDAAQALSIDVTYDRTELRTGDTVTATATVTNHQRRAAPMLIVDLPIPPGFEPDRAAINQWVTRGDAAKVQFTPRQIIVYLRQLSGETTLQLSYPLRATMPVDAAAPAAKAYEYYDPAVEARSEPARLRVEGRS